MFVPHLADVCGHPGEPHHLGHRGEHGEALSQCSKASQSPLAYSEPGLSPETKLGSVLTSQSYCGLLPSTPQGSLLPLLPCGAWGPERPNQPLSFFRKRFLRAFPTIQSLDSDRYDTTCLAKPLESRGAQDSMVLLHRQQQKGNEVWRSGGTPLHPWTLSSCY